MPLVVGRNSALRWKSRYTSRLPHVVPVYPKSYLRYVPIFNAPKDNQTNVLCGVLSCRIGGKSQGYRGG